MKTVPRALLVAACALLAGHPSGAGGLLEPLLSPGVAAEFELALDGSRRHSVALQAGELLQVAVREDGPRVALVLIDEKGTTVARREPVVWALGSLRLFAVADATGAYVVEVRSSGEGRSGSYHLRLDTPRAASAGDHALAAADAALAEAVGLALGPDAERRRRAFAPLEAAEAGFREAAEDQGQALALLLRANVQLTFGDTAARGVAERALALFREVGDREGEGAALIELGWATLPSGDHHGARAHFQAAADTAEAIHSRRLLTSAFNGVGVTFGRTGDAERAAEAWERTLAIAAELGSPRAQGAALHNLSTAYTDLGDLHRSLECYERALALWRQMGKRDSEAMTLIGIAGVHMQLGDDPRGFALLEEALPMARAAGLREWEARALGAMAKVLGRSGEPGRGLDLGRQALEIVRQIGDRRSEGLTLLTLGRNLHRAGDTPAALRHLEEALAIQRRFGFRHHEIETLGAMADIERDRDNPRASLARAEEAFTLTETLRSEVTNPDLRTSFVAFKHDMYGRYIGALMRLHSRDPAGRHDAAALQASERARARVLLETLIEARADIRQGVEPSLLARERALQKELSRASARLSRALARAAAPEDVARARQEVEARSDEYRRHQSRIRQESPLYAALTQPVPASVEDIRREVLDDETVLLEFYLGADESYLWALTRTDLVSLQLAPQAVIEAAARRIHVLLSERQRTRALEAVRAADERLADESLALSRLLMAGIAERLETDWKGRRLLVVSAGALAYLPFGALPSPAGAARPLLLDHEIVFAPSASALRAVRSQRPLPAASHAVAVLADPVFEAADPRVRPGTGPPAASGTSPLGLTRAMASLGRSGFGRLPFSRREAEAIAALVPRASLLKATDFDATRALVTSGALGDRRIVHFATHGLLDSEHPDLSGLVLSLVDEKGVAQDGFLRMHEIYNLKLPADLVVLSACQTALGREIRGEGLVGVTRGFMYAGARRVVASLWQVDDESTAELMSRFYRTMLQEGRRPPDALRTAQLELSRNPRWRAPFYWAGFVLQGEWR